MIGSLYAPVLQQSLAAGNSATRNANIIARINHQQRRLLCALLLKCSFAQTLFHSAALKINIAVRPLTRATYASSPSATAVFSLRVRQHGFCLSLHAHRACCDHHSFGCHGRCFVLNCLGLRTTHAARRTGCSSGLGSGSSPPHAPARQHTTTGRAAPQTMTTTTASSNPSTAPPTR